jgi:DUF4097 and DUF4098 domain-containing protein YvlB
MQEHWFVTEPRVIDVGNVRALKVSLIGGQVDVIGHDEPIARVEVHSVSGKELKIAIDGDTLEIDHPQLRWDNFVSVFASFRDHARADVSVLVPRSVELKLGVVSAEALVSGIRSDAKLNTVSGSVVVDDVEGDIDLNSVNGEFSVRGHRGDIEANTVSGDITASGAISRFSANGVSGDVALDLSGVPLSVDNSTVSGDLTVRLPRSLRALFTVNTVSGTLQLDDVQLRGVRGRGHTSASGPEGYASVAVRANSVSGDISVVRTPELAGADLPADGSGAPA